MNGPLQARLWGLVRGNSVVAIAAIVAEVGIAYSPLPEPFKILFATVLAPVVLATAWRMVWGTEEGSTDLEATREGLRIYNLPPESLERALALAIRGYTGRRALPRPVGTVQGNPARDADLIPDEGASLPETVEVTDRPIEIPGEAGQLP